MHFSVFVSCILLVYSEMPQKDQMQCKHIRITFTKGKQDCYLDENNKMQRGI